jgi:phospholipid/cholesterol/gamma-HCH transport system substrate-binding protein
MTRGSSGTTLRLKGLVLVVLVGLLVTGAIASYLKVFVPSVEVTVLSSRAGLQLPANGDVRVRGALVGRVVDVAPANPGVRIRLALEPEAAELVPSGSVARILPTTLFGQKYVELVARGDAPPVEDGAVLEEDTSTEAVEVTRVVDHLEPLLRAVRPEQLSATLEALAEGLRDRGEQLGETLSSVERYLAALEVDLPTLATDLRLLGVVSRTYADATPDLLRLLQGATTTGDTILDNREHYAAFAADLTDFALVTREFLDDNGDGIVEVTAKTRPVLELLGTYSPEFPCVFQGLLRAETVAGGAFRDGVFHADVELGLQYPGYTAEDLPRFGDLGTGPHCAGLPDVPQPVPAHDSRDGVEQPPGTTLPPLRTGIPPW